MYPTRSSLPFRAAIAALVLFGVACGDSGAPTAPPTPSPPGSLQATVRTTGGDLDFDGYDLVFGSGARIRVPSNGTVVSSVAPGAHLVTLERVAGNCSVKGAHPIPVTVTSGTTVEVTIEVVCETTGIEITTRTKGAEYAASYRFQLNAQSRGTIEANASLVVSRLQPGDYTLALVLPGSHCTVSGSNSVTVTVSQRAVTPVSFDLTCVAPTREPRIAFVTRGIISLVKVDGQGTTELIDGHGPAWSPDGKRLLFSNTDCYYYYSCTGSIGVIDPETRAIQMLDKAVGFSPAMAPMGDRIAFTDADGKLSLLRLADSQVTVLPTPEMRWNSSPSWSPDGGRIVFRCYTVSSPDLCVINQDGSQFARLTDGEQTDDGDPAWGPDGRIAFTRFHRQGSVSEIWLVGLDGSAAKLTDGGDPAWSPGGSKLVFFGVATGSSTAWSTGLYSINADGTDRRQLTNGDHYDPAWRP